MMTSSTILSHNTITLLPSLSQWDTVVDTQIQELAINALESGKVLLLPHLPFALTPEETSLFNIAPEQTTSKNETFN
jgi:hypothetical protein